MLSLIDELAAHLTYLEQRGFPFDDIARSALFAQLADERGVTTQEINRRLMEELTIRIHEITERNEET